MGYFYEVRIFMKGALLILAEIFMILKFTNYPISCHDVLVVHVTQLATMCTHNCGPQALAS